MPIDVLKMDRGFVRNIEYEEKDKQLVGLIINIAKSLKIPVVAEGVETEEQVRLLKELGCEIIQGYYFSEPLHVSVFEDTYVRPLQEHDGAGNASTDE
jgi:EAL domain-containing protein (putative c-di-GMP-specific phosphodiesterase class I)